MNEKFQNLRNKMSPERRAKVDAMTKKMLGEMPMHEFSLTFGDYTLEYKEGDKCSDGLWLYNTVPEGIRLTEEDMENMLDGYFKENF